MTATRWCLAAATGLLGLVVALDSSAQDGGKPGRGRGRGPDNAPKVGAKAPDFTLKELDVEKGVPRKDPTTEKDVEVKLSDVWKAGKPVALIFGSYT